MVNKIRCPQCGRYLLAHGMPCPCGWDVSRCDPYSELYQERMKIKDLEGLIIGLNYTLERIAVLIEATYLGSVDLELDRKHASREWLARADIARKAVEEARAKCRELGLEV